MLSRSRNNITSGNWKLRPNSSGSVTAKLIHSERRICGWMPIISLKPSRNFSTKGNTR